MPRNHRRALYEFIATAVVLGAVVAGVSVDVQAGPGAPAGPPAGPPDPFCDSIRSGINAAMGSSWRVLQETATYLRAEFEDDPSVLMTSECNAATGEHRLEVEGMGLELTREDTLDEGEIESNVLVLTGDSAPALALSTTHSAGDVAGQTFVFDTANFGQGYGYIWSTSVGDGGLSTGFLPVPGTQRGGRRDAFAARAHGSRLWPFVHAMLEMSLSVPSSDPTSCEAATETTVQGCRLAFVEVLTATGRSKYAAHSECVQLAFEMEQACR